MPDGWPGMTIYPHLLELVQGIITASFNICRCDNSHVYHIPILYNNNSRVCSRNNPFCRQNLNNSFFSSPCMYMCVSLPSSRRVPGGYRLIKGGYDKPVPRMFNRSRPRDQG
ncbi:hypothetical protein CBL_13056 [Carabus blaptoides fortunei]